MLGLPAQTLGFRFKFKNTAYYFVSYVGNVFYAPKQKVMYQSLVQKRQSSGENLTGLSETNWDGERKEEVNKSRNTPIAKSQTGVQNDRTSKSGFPNSEIEL